MKGLGVLIMAAGKGTRMKSSLPKVLHPILDRPMLDYLIRSVQNVLPDRVGDEVAVLVGANGEQVESHVKATFGDSVKVLWQHELLGTAHAVQSARDWWENLDTLVVLNGDLPLLCHESLAELLYNFNESGLDCAVMSFVTDNPGTYGRIIHGIEGVRIVEYKDATLDEKRVREVNAGCYVFRVAALKQVIDLVKNDNAQGEYYLPDVLSLMNASALRVSALTMPEDEMIGVNTQSELALATRHMRLRINDAWMNKGVRMMAPETVWIGPDVELAPDVVLMPNVQLWGKTKVGQGACIGSGCILTNAILGRNVNLVANVLIENSTLEDNAKAGPFAYIRENSHLKQNSFAGKFVELKKTTVGEGSKVPHLSYMGDTTLGSGVNIGAGTITCNYDGVNKHATQIGDNCFVGSDTMFVAPVTMGDGASTAAGSVITQAVPDGALGVGRAHQRNISGWSERMARKQKD